MTGGSAEQTHRPRRRRLALALLIVTLVGLSGCNALGGTDAPTTEPPTTTGTDVPTSARQPAEPTTSPSTPTATATRTSTVTPTATPTPTPTATPTTAEPAIEADPAVVFERLSAMLSVDMEQPNVSTYEFSNNSLGVMRRYPYVAVFTGEQSPSFETRPSAVYGGGDVWLGTRFLREAGPDREASALAHEFGHAVTLQRDWIPTQLQAEAEDIQIETAVIEGSATYVQTEYERRYLNRSYVARARRLYENGTTWRRVLWAPYVKGAAYFDERFDDPSNLSTLARQFPNSTEQLLHHSEEAPRPLEIDADDTDTWATRALRRARGELLTRIILRAELNKSRASSAADGWGTDRMVDVDGPEGDGYVWVHRWDSRAEADEFAAAVSTFVDRRNAAAADLTYRSVRVAPETTAIVAGHASVVNGVRVSGGNATVSVTVGE